MSNNYQGPGLYVHHKGGYYDALGLGEVEYNGKLLVVYKSLSEVHSKEREGRGISFILRPLEPEDGPDAWNDSIQLPVGRTVPRFHKLTVPPGLVRVTRRTTTGES